MKSETQIIGREVVWEGDYLRGVRITYLTPDGERKIWEFVERKNPNIVSIVLYDKECKKFILVEQPRFPVGGKAVIGFVSGVCDEKGESQKATVIRESCEEAGLEPQKVWLISENCAGSAGFGNEIKTTFWGTDLKPVDKKKGSEEDAITIHSVPRETIFVWLEEQPRQGKIVEDNVVGNIAYVLRIIEQEEQEERKKEREQIRKEVDMHDRFMVE